MSKLGIVASREVSTRVRKKTFIITTLLMPVLFLALCAAPSLVMLFGGKGDTKTIAVVDETQGAYVSSQLQSSEQIQFIPMTGSTKADAIAAYGSEDKAFGILFIGADIIDNPAHIQLILNGSAAMAVEEEITAQVNAILRMAKLQSYQIEGLDRMIAESDIRVELETVKNDGSGDEDSMETTSTSMSMMLSLLLGMVLYMFIILYGQSVMTTVIEEKQSRVLDVMVTSCTPFDLMMGKILGIAAVAAIQVAIWGVLIVGASKLLLPLLMPEGIMESAGGMLSAIGSTLGDPAYMAKIFTWLFLFILFGFLFYASLYAAVGSSVDTAQDAQQFNAILIMPIILALIVMMQVFNDPNSPLVFWCSLIPFTSPLVMMARVPFDVPTWQILLSLALLAASFIASTWLAARIFRIGIFMHGKKPTWKDLAQWIKMK